jgi:hypothetical protein
MTPLGRLSLDLTAGSGMATHSMGGLDEALNYHPYFVPFLTMGGHGLARGWLGPTMPCPSTAVSGVAACRVGGLWPFPTPLNTPRRTPLFLAHFGLLCGRGKAETLDLRRGKGKHGAWRGSWRGVSERIARRPQAAGRPAGGHSQALGRFRGGHLQGIEE